MRNQSDLRIVKESARRVGIPCGPVKMVGDLNVPENALGVVLFAHGNGSSRHSPRDRAVADVLHQSGIGTLLIDLLTPEEERAERQTGHLRFDIPLLAERLAAATRWLANEPATRGLAIGYFGARTGAAAALVAAAQHPEAVHAIVSRGGRPDLAGSHLARVKAPTLLIVGGDDGPVLDMNQQALMELRAEKQIEIIPGAINLFEEPGALDAVAGSSREWFARCMKQAAGEQRKVA